MKNSTFLSILVGITITGSATYATTVNMDSAANYSSWTDGSNEGGGFEAWSITSDSGTDGHTGFEILSSTNALLKMGEAFGFTALGTDASITLSRDFSTALDDGDVFELDLGMNYDCGNGDGSKGFILYTADGREVVVVNQGNSTNITVNGETALSEYGTATMYWTFTQNSATELTIFATGRGGESENYTEVIELTEESYIAGIRFYANGIENDDYSALRAVYFNNLTLSQGASSDATFDYSTENGHVIITEIAKDTSGALIIPSTLGGSPVTEIARTAGAYCTNITSLSFVNGSMVTNMGYNAFQGCTALQSAALPDGLTAIPDHLFYNCSSLRSVSIPSAVESIGNSAFAECRALTAVDLPEGLTSLGESVFINCRSLTALDFPDGITDLAGQLCYECQSLSSLTLPANATNIGYRAFYNCQALESLEIPSAIATIEDGAFQGCTALATLAFDGILTDIADEAFYGCSSLESIYFNGGVDVLGDRVFGQDSNLTALYFMCDVPSLEEGEDLFISSPGVTIYYLTDSSNWGSTLAGATVTVWAPSIVAIDTESSPLQITLEWAGSGTVTLQACTNLAEGSWYDVDTGAISDGTCVLSDSNDGSNDHCCYRAVVQ